MATTEHFYTGNNSTTSFAFTFPYLANSDVKVELNNDVKTENSSGQTNNDYTINNTNIVFNSAPGTGVAIHIYRTTNVDTAQAQYAAGSSIRAADLNNNQTQLLYSAQEAGGQLIRQTDLKDSIVNSAKIADGSIATGDLADSLITTAKIANSNVTTAKIADSNVTTAKIADNNVTTAKIAADAITGAKIADDSINSEHYVDGSIDTAHIADGQVTHVKLANDAVDGDNISDDSINSEHYVDGSIDTAHIADSQVTTAKIATDAVTTVKITDLNVTTAKIAADAITGAKIADDAVDSEHLAADSIDAEHYAAGSVDTTALGADAVTGAKIADDAIDSEHYTDGSIDTAHIGGSQVTDVKLASNSVTTSKITDANVTTVKIADSNVTLAKLASDLKQTSISDSDTQLPTSGAVVDYVAAQLAPIGGLEVIATDAAFPNTQPASGVVISIADAGGLVVNGSGTSTTGRTVGGSTVTINNIASNFNSSTVDAGVCFQVSSTGSGQIYNYHKATLKEADLLNLSNDINDFGNRYRVNAGEPTSNNDEGDLVYDTNADKMKVYDSSTSAWKEVTSTGDFKYLFLCPAGGSGAPTLNGSIATYDLRESSNSGSAASVTSAAQLLVSINGVVQKANTGTSAPAEGFALVDANTIVFGANLASGDSVFIVQFGSALTITTPGDGTVSAAKIASGAVTTAKIADDAVDADKLASNAVVTASIVDDAVTLAKMAGIARGKIIYGDSSGNPAVLTVGSNGQVLQSDGTDISWQNASAGATGGNSNANKIFWENENTVTHDYTIQNNHNAGSFGPITINNGVTVTVGSGETWTIV